MRYEHDNRKELPINVKPGFRWWRKLIHGELLRLREASGGDYMNIRNDGHVFEPKPLSNIHQRLKQTKII